MGHTRIPYQHTEVERLRAERGVGHYRKEVDDAVEDMDLPERCREVAKLMTSMTNREIADALQLSVRKVEACLAGSCSERETDASRVVGSWEAPERLRTWTQQRPRTWLFECELCRARIRSMRHEPYREV